MATFHAYSGWSPPYEFGKRMLGRFARRLHGRIAVSAAARHFIERYFPGDYKVIPNGVDLEPSTTRCRSHAGKDGTPNILYVGRFEPRKGVMYRSRRTARCAARLRRRLLVAGTGRRSAKCGATSRRAA